MTLPCERARAVQYAREFMRALLDPKQTPRVPKKIRQWAYGVLRHYPHTFEMNRVAEQFPGIFEVISEESAGKGKQE